MASAATGAAARAGPGFRIGGKQVFLPNHVITLIRPKERQPPTFATFIVPLSFNKLDLRDYLWHAYGVETKGIRSFVNSQRPDRRSLTGAWYRPRAQKMMMAELARPFVWPALPEDTAPWDKDMHDRLLAAQREQQERSQAIMRPRAQGVLRDEKTPSREHRVLASEARSMLEGRVRWRNNIHLDEKWLEAGRKIREEAAKTGGGGGGGGGKSAEQE